ncbi:MAG TPA: cyclic nucleotide-binding domain-containing protein [Acidimicrobiales bacterium]
MITIAAALAGQNLFAGLTQEQLDEVAACARTESVPAGTVLFREGRQADRFYLVASGTVALSLHVPQRGFVLVDTVHGGELVGWSWLFAPYVWHFDGRVLEDAELVVVDGPALRTRCEADPALGYALMQRFAEVIHRRLQHTRLRLLDVYGVHDGA